MVSILFLVLMWLFFVPMMYLVIKIINYGRTSNIIILFILTFVFVLFIYNIPQIDNLIEKQNTSQPFSSALPTEYYSDYIKVGQTQTKVQHINLTIYDTILSSYSIESMPILAYQWDNFTHQYLETTHLFSIGQYYSETFSINDISYIPILLSDVNSGWTVWSNYTGIVTDLTNYHTIILDNQTIPSVFPIDSINDTKIIYLNITRTLTFPIDLQTSDNYNLSNLIFVIQNHPNEAITFQPDAVETKTPPSLWDYIWIIPLVCSASCLIIFFLKFTIERGERRSRRQSREESVRSMMRHNYDHEELQRLLQQELTSLSRTTPIIPYNLPFTNGDFKFKEVVSKDKLQKEMYKLRRDGYWTKVVNVNPTTSAIYISTWKQKQTSLRGIPIWNLQRR